MCLAIAAAIEQVLVLECLHDTVKKLKMAVMMVHSNP